MKKKTFYYSILIVLILASIATTAGYLGRYNWFLDLFSHFRVQYLVVLMIGAFGLAMLRRKAVLYFLPFLFLNGIEILPLYIGDQENNTVDHHFKLICINLLSSNTEFEAVRTFIQNESPDMLVLEEVNERWTNNLESILQQYNYRTVNTRDDNFGIALYSRIELGLSEIQYIGNPELPSIVSKFQWGKDSITLIATHPLPPVGQWRSDDRNNQFRALATTIKDIESQTILIGDLNCSSFSVHFNDLMNTTGLKDTRRGFGILPTWPTWFAMVKTTLDHCLVSKDLLIKSRSVGEDVGSDHLPIIVEIGME